MRTLLALPLARQRAVSLVLLSPSTERLDKHEKFLAWRSLDSLQEYLLVHQDTREVWLFRRESGWHREVFTEGELGLASVGVKLLVAEVYRNVGLVDGIQ